MKDLPDVEYVTVPKRTYDAADYLAKLGRHANPQGFIDSDNDWKIFVKIVEVWAKHYHEDYVEFVDSVKAIKDANAWTDGKSKQGEAMLMHHLELPEKLFWLIQAIYPNQKLDEKFVNGVKKHTPLFYVR